MSLCLQTFYVLSHHTSDVCSACMAVCSEPMQWSQPTGLCVVWPGERISSVLRLIIQAYKLVKIQNVHFCAPIKWEPYKVTIVCPSVCPEWFVCAIPPTLFTIVMGPCVFYWFILYMWNHMCNFTCRNGQF